VNAKHKHASFFVLARLSTAESGGKTVSIAEESTAAKINHRPTVSTGAGIAIAGMWIVVCGLLAFLAWLLQTQMNVRLGGVSAIQPGMYILIGICYIAFAITVVLIAAWGTHIIRTGGS
jgi:uncharacterized membrane protein